MVHIFICPACRAEHGEPADAILGLAVVCLDCALALAWHERNSEATLVAVAA